MEMEVGLSTDVKPVNRPVRILASYVMDAENVTVDYANELHTLASNAGRALTATGDDVQVIFVNANETGANVDRSLKNIDGVLVLGGADVDPSRYTTDAAEIAKVESTNPDADEFEITLIKTALDQGLPVLGICRGSQAINVAFGGSLITDLGSDTIHRVPAEGDWTNHDVEIVDGSRLEGIYPEKTVDIRSAHHQAIDVVAPGLKVAAVAPDGIIEAVEAADDRWLVGVQWHPEDGEGNAEHLNLLAQALVTESRKHHPASLTV